MNRKIIIITIGISILALLLLLSLGAVIMVKTNTYKKQIKSVIHSAIYDDKYNEKLEKNITKNEWEKIKYAIDDDKAKYEKVFIRIDDMFLFSNTGETNVYVEYYSFHKKSKSGKYNIKKCDNGVAGNMKIRYKKEGDNIIISFDNEDFY